MSAKQPEKILIKSFLPQLRNGGNHSRSATVFSEFSDQKCFDLFLLFDPHYLLLLANCLVKE